MKHGTSSVIEVAGRIGLVGCGADRLKFVGRTTQEMDKDRFLRHTSIYLEHFLDLPPHCPLDHQVCWSFNVAKKSFRCRVVTPSASLVDHQVVYASIPAWDGALGVQPGRAPILARLGIGELRLDYPDTDKGPGGSRTFVVDGGFVRMVNDQLTVLAEAAFAAESLSASEVEGQLKKIESTDAGAQRTHDLALAKAKLKAARGTKAI